MRSLVQMKTLQAMAESGECTVVVGGLNNSNTFSLLKPRQGWLILDPKRTNLTLFNISDKFQYLLAGRITETDLKVPINMGLTLVMRCRTHC